MTYSRSHPRSAPMTTSVPSLQFPNNRATNPENNRRTVHKSCEELDLYFMNLLTPLYLKVPLKCSVTWVPAELQRGQGHRVIMTTKL